MITRPKVAQYAEQLSSPERPWLARLAEETRHGTEVPEMLSGAHQGQFLAALVHMLRPATVLEIGTFTGYSAIAMAEALPPGGRIITCEVSERYADVARRHVAASPWAGRIEVRTGPALQTIESLGGRFDLVFIDADKPSYLRYYEVLLPRLSDRGVMVVDNVLWGGRVVAEGDQSEDTVAIRRFNEVVCGDPRVEQVIVPIRDGVTLIRRAPPAPPSALDEADERAAVRAVGAGERPGRGAGPGLA